MVCLGFKPGATGWYVQTKAWSYGGHSNFTFFVHSFLFMRSLVVSVTRSLDYFRYLATNNNFKLPKIS